MAQYSKYDAWLDSATDRDLQLAARAVVDAAICCRGAKKDLERCPSELERLLLVEALYEDPSLTARLFDGSSWDLEESLL